MNADFLARLVQAQTEEEKDWLLAELSLSVLSPELREMALSAAVPHWFDANILGALQPDLAQQAEALYLQLQHLPFVEVFPDRGYNIHERTRKAMLKHLWETDREAFKQFSQRLVDYFGAENTNRIEQIYHAVAADFEAGSSQFEDYITHLDHNFRRGEAEALLAAVEEQVEPKLERYDTALKLYEQVGDNLGKANTLRAIGDVLQFLKRCDEALERYDTALKLFEQVGDNLGKANTLSAIGDVALANDRYSEALQYYHRALALVEQIHDLYSTARVWYYIGTTGAAQGNKPEAISAFTTAASIFRNINLEDLAQFCERAIEEIE